MADEAFYLSQPRKRMAAGALLFDDAGRLLLVKPTYRDLWGIPGGGVEADESPRVGCERELAEELGLERAVRRLLVVGWKRPEPPQDESLLFVFDGGVLTADEIGAIRLPPDELSTFAFVDRADVPGLLPRRTGRCVTAALALPPGVSAYMDDETVFPSGF
jgi:ADP-ribose pyrophosphatase YjhB (NUDIX family)